MSKYLAIVLVFLFSNFGFSQEPKGEVIDSILELSRSFDQSAKSVDRYTELSDKYFFLGMRHAIDSLEAFQQKAIDLARDIDYKEGLAKALYIKGKFQITARNKYAKATPAILEALSIYEELDDQRGIALCYMQLGLISYILQYYEDAIKNFKLSLQYDDIITSTYLMGISYSELGNFDEAKKYFGLSIEEYKNSGKLFKLNECYMYLGRLFEKQNELDSAFFYLNMSLENISKNDPSDLIRPRALISSVYLERNEIDKAIEYAQLSYNEAVKGTDMISRIEASRVLSKAYKLKKNYKQAHYFLDLYTDLNSKFIQGSTKQKVADMQSLFDFKKKIDDEKLRSQKDQEIAEQTIQKEKILRNSFLFGSVLLLILSFVLYNRYNIKRRSTIALEEKNQIISKEKKRSDDLLLNILPAEIAEELKENGKAEAKDFELASIIFTDFISFTEASEKLSATELVSEVGACFEAFDNILDKYNIEKIKTIGDAYMAAGGIPVPTEDSAKNSILCALEMQEFISERKKDKDVLGKPAFEMRLGIHSGPIVAGIVGLKKFQYDIWGDTVNTASRLESNGEAGKVNISQKTYELIKDESIFEFENRGKISVKGKGEINMWFVHSKNGSGPL